MCCVQKPEPQPSSRSKYNRNSGGDNIFRKLLKLSLDKGRNSCCYLECN